VTRARAWLLLVSSLAAVLAAQVLANEHHWPWGVSVGFGVFFGWCALAGILRLLKSRDPTLHEWLQENPDRPYRDDPPAGGRRDG
jgi:uncharacterized membrane protein YbjE (DUF340 family)